MGIERHSPAPQQAICATAVANSTEISMVGFAGGLVILPSNINSATTLSFYVAGGPTGRSNPDQTAYVPTYCQLVDDTMTNITRVPAVSKAFRIPLEAFAAGSLKIVSDAQITVEVLLKA
jgi:hypothetical protein